MTARPAYTRESMRPSGRRDGRSGQRRGSISTNRKITDEDHDAHVDDEERPRQADQTRGLRLYDDGQRPTRAEMERRVDLERCDGDRMKSLLSYALIVFTTILLFDVSLFFVLPTEYALDFDGYRFHRDTRPPK